VVVCQLGRGTQEFDIRISHEAQRQLRGVGREAANGVRLKSVVKPFAEWRRGKMEMQNSALLYLYQKNKTTKLAWQIIYCDRIGRFKTPANYDNRLSDDL
jgi:hypothetical protein